MYDYLHAGHSAAHLICPFCGDFLSWAASMSGRRVCASCEEAHTRRRNVNARRLIQAPRPMPSDHAALISYQEHYRNARRLRWTLRHRSRDMRLMCAAAACYTAHHTSQAALDAWRDGWASMDAAVCRYAWDLPLELVTGGLL